MAGVTADGFTAKTALEIKAEIEADWREEFGANVDLSPDSPDGQIIGINSFNAVFGLGSLVGANGDVIVQPAEVSVAAANTAPGYDASTAAIVFNIHPTATFIYNIVGFADGDKLVFDGGTAVGLTNTGGTDGVIVVQGSLNGQVATVRLSGIAPASDSAIFGVNSFNTEFGPGSLGTLQ